MLQFDVPELAKGIYTSAVPIYICSHLGYVGIVIKNVYEHLYVQRNTKKDNQQVQTKKLKTGDL